MTRSIALLCAMLALTACQREPAAPLTHEAYVWQRQWTATLDTSLNDAAQTFAAYRVLALETDRNGRLAATRLDLGALASTRRPLVAVVRLDGAAAPPDAGAVASALADVARDWRAAGLTLSGVEIDHDCESARLDAYAHWLRELRRSLPANTKLSIAVLPEWIGATALAQLLAVADESVLQAHVAQSPRHAAFDLAAARRPIDAYAQATSKPFRVALPARGGPAPADDGGMARAVEPSRPGTSEGGAPESNVTPDDAAQLLRNLERARPARLAGLVWFRLPTGDDRGAWSVATLRAVVAGEPLRAVVQVSFDKDETGANDLVLANQGAVDAPLPLAIVIAALGCDAGDAHEGFRLERIGDDWRFVATAKNVLSVGRQQQVGWLRCDVIGGIKIDDAARDAPLN